ncbi:MAG: hypothetical protein AVDCRST_MAG28-370, partial [uncultured Rubrobacteraceae bacterium]
VRSRLRVPVRGFRPRVPTVPNRDGGAHDATQCAARDPDRRV